MPLFNAHTQVPVHTQLSHPNQDTQVLIIAEDS